VSSVIITILLLLHQPSTDSHTAKLQFACGSCSMACSSTPTSRRLSSLAPLLSSGQLPTSPLSRSPEALRRSVAPQLKSLGVTIDSNLRFDCHSRNIAKACNFHTRALRHVHSLLTRVGTKISMIYINDIYQWYISWYYHDIFKRKYHDIYHRKYQPFFITFFLLFAMDKQGPPLPLAWLHHRLALVPTRRPPTTSALLRENGGSTE